MYLGLIRAGCALPGPFFPLCKYQFLSFSLLFFGKDNFTDLHAVWVDFLLWTCHPIFIISQISPIFFVFPYQLTCTVLSLLFSNCKDSELFSPRVQPNAAFSICRLSCVKDAIFFSLCKWFKSSFMTSKVHFSC